LGYFLKDISQIGGLLVLLSVMFSTIFVFQRLKPSSQLVLTQVKEEIS
jgi:hypothetical protein